MENIIIALILAAIVGGAVWYLVRAKRRGEKCVGCPHAKVCGKNCGCASSPSQGKKDDSPKHSEENG